MNKCKSPPVYWARVPVKNTVPGTGIVYVWIPLSAHLRGHGNDPRDFLKQEPFEGDEIDISDSDNDSEEVELVLIDMFKLLLEIIQMMQSYSVYLK